jgi:predicted metal-dependent hydrolase
LDEAQALLTAGMPFHAHEVLEDAWKSADADERELWRGLAQLAVGLTHAARGNRHGAIALLNRGAASIAAFADRDPHGVDIAGLTRWTLAACNELQAVGSSAHLAPPVLRVSPP